EDDPDGFRVREREDELDGQGLFAQEYLLPLRISDHVAVDAALQDVALVVEAARILPFEAGKFFRRGNARGRASLPRQLFPIGRAAAVQLECALERPREAFDRNVVSPERPVGASAE